jgi:leucyl-tRNA synthetase
MFMGPLEAVKPWQTSQMAGVVRFRDRLYSAVQKSVAGTPVSDETKKLVHRTTKKVTQDIEAMAFNTAISAMMVLTNHLLSLPSIPRDAVLPLIQLVSPFAPHLGEELWNQTGHAATLAYEPWPTWDEALCVDDVVDMPVQVNGKVRGKVTLAKTASEAEARDAALAVEAIAALTTGKTIKKVVYVPGKILNLVVG